MKNPLGVLLSILISLGVGILLGWTLFGEQTAARAGALDISAKVNSLQIDQPPDELRVLSALDSGQRAQVSISARQGRDTPAGSHGAAVAGSPLDAKAEGGSIRGVVTTLDGQPLAGVDLEIRPVKSASRCLAEITSSGADGRFEFTGLPDESWTVTAIHSEYVVQRRTAYPPGVATGATVEFVACPATAVEVRVHGADASQARVAFRRMDSGDEPKWSSWSADDPRIALGPGSWELSACVDPLEDWPSNRGWKLSRLASVPSTVHVGVDPGSVVVTLQLESINCLYGAVQFPEGHQSGASYPQVMIVEPGNGTRGDFDSAGERVLLRSYLDERGRYGLYRLPYSRWTSAVGLSWGSAAIGSRIVDVSGLTALNFSASDLDDENSVVVDVYTSAGQRVTHGVGFHFEYRNPGDDPEEDYVYQYTRTMLAEDGSLRVIALPMDSEEEEEAGQKQEVVLSAQLSGFAPSEHPLSGLEGQRITIRLEPGAELRVVLMGAGAERAMRNCDAYLKGVSSGHSGEFDDESSAIILRGAKPGIYTLTLYTSGRYGEYRWERLYCEKVTLNSGVNTLEVQIPTRSDLVVLCPGVKEGVEASLWSFDDEPTRDRINDWGGTSIDADVDARGQVTFKQVLAGTYQLAIGPRIQIVRVPSSPVQFAGAVPTRFRVRLSDKDSPLRRAGVLSGDMLVAIDGEEHTKEVVTSRLNALGTQSVGRVQLTVERSGIRRDILLDAAVLASGETFDLSLEPVL
jgi:hypothetical protein